MLNKNVPSKINELSASLEQKATKQELQNIGSASPKGVYNTLSALQSAFPTGTTGIYVISADGKWYYWNGSVWIAGGVYQATGISEKSVTIANTNFMKLGKNKFNKDTVTSGYYVSQVNGTLLAGAFYATDFIEINPNTQYTKNDTNTWAFYDVNKTFISGGNASYTVTTPANAKYIRYSIPSNKDLSVQMFVEGTTLGKYESYFYEPVYKDKSILLEKDIPSTTQSIVFNSDGAVQKVEHKDSDNVVVRTDSFAYTTNLITETRSLTYGGTLTYKYHLDTLETEVI